MVPVDMTDHDIVNVPIGLEAAVQETGLDVGGTIDRLPPEDVLGRCWNVLCQIPFNPKIKDESLQFVGGWIHVLDQECHRRHRAEFVGVWLRDEGGLRQRYEPSIQSSHPDVHLILCRAGQRGKRYAALCHCHCYIKLAIWSVWVPRQYSMLLDQAGSEAL